MLNKKGIIGIAVFIVAALFTYAFASPNQKVEEEKDKGNNTEVVEQEKKQEETTPVVDNQVVAPVVAQTAPATITNNPVVNNDQEQIIDLTEAKNKAKDELKNYADSKDLDEEYTEELEKIVTDGNEAIDNATSEENITKALEDAKKLVDELVAKSDLEKYKKELVDELNTYYNSLEFTDTEDEESESKATLNNGVTSINDSEDKESADKSLEDAKKSLDDLKKKQDLEKKKEESINELTEYHNTLFGEGNEESKKVLTDGIDAINNAETIEEVNTALENAKDVLDAEKARQDLVNAKNNAITDLVEYYDTLFDKENSEANEVLTTGKAGINNAKTVEEVNTALQNAKDALDAEKARQDLINAKNNAINELTEYHNTLFGEKGYENSKAILSDGIQKINDAKNTEDVATALSNAKTELDNLKKSQELANAKAAAKKELEQYKKDLSFDKYKKYLNRANAIVKNGNDAIDKTTTIKGVATALQSAKDLLDELKQELMAPAKLSLKGNDNIILTRKVFGDDYKDAGINVQCNSNCTKPSISTRFTAPYGDNSSVTSGMNVKNLVEFYAFTLIPKFVPEAGTYEIIYTVTNDFGVSTSITRTVKIARFAEEVSAGNDIVIDFDKNPYNVCRTEYCQAPVIPDAKAYDYVNGKWFNATDITDRMTSTGSVDTTKIGDYTINYEVTDWLGYKEPSTRNIQIRDLEAPTINFKGTKTISYEGKKYTIPNVDSVTDNYDYDIEYKEGYDTHTEGLVRKKKYFDVIYTATDSSGKETRIVKSYKMK